MRLASDYLLLLGYSLLCGATHVAAIASSGAAYAPTSVACPSTGLVRDASGLSPGESDFYEKRKALADSALRKWLSRTSNLFAVGNTTLPTIGLTTSGGGYRSLLVGAGVIQGMDARDSYESTSGLFQALTYQSGLSGGGWLLSSLAGNNYPTISQLQDDLWEQAFQDGLLTPHNKNAPEVYNRIAAEVAAKHEAGFDTTLTDPYGRLLSYQLFPGPGYGANLSLSSVAEVSNLTTHAAPLPIIVCLGVKTFEGEKVPGPNATIYEFTPFEFGSWDSDVSAFVATESLGTSFSGGQPVNSSECVQNYDNLGYVLGVSSNVFNQLSLSTPSSSSSAFLTDNSLWAQVEATLNRVHETTTSDLFAVFANPFYGYTSATMQLNPANRVADQEKLHLVDGGEALQNNPIWPMLQPARGVDVLFVNDNSADTVDSFPNGTEILTTYVQTFNHNHTLTRMPYIPEVETFLEEGLNKRATFFGCDDPDRITIVYLPNTAYTFPSNVPTAKLQYSKAETRAMIRNGVAVATQDGEEGWGVCLGCAILRKTEAVLPEACEACFGKYCYRP
ncbi:lysophospholipase [Aspergillus carlsbadensis]|nr:lysophospholipase [Aspergillus carlsbadensis]